MILYKYQKIYNFIIYLSALFYIFYYFYRFYKSFYNKSTTTNYSLTPYSARQANRTK